MSTPTTAAAIAAEAPQAHGNVNVNSDDNLSLGDINLEDDITNDIDYNGDYIQEDLPPLRMHATRVPQRLSGSSSNMSIPPGLGTSVLHYNHKGSGTGTPRSRSRSPSMKDRTTATTHDSHSSMSSLDDIVDLDILTDRAGLEELDLSESQRKMHMNRESTGNLPSVNERMSEDALEDVHAFSDVVRSSNCSRANSIGTGGAVLEPLSEYDDEESDDLDDIQEEDGGEAGLTPQVILTNMENLNLELSQPDGAARGTRGTGESSLIEEAPSAKSA